MNVRTLTEEFFETAGSTYVHPNDNERLWFHDSLHALLNLPETYRNEFIVGIYQAVLLDTLYVGPAKTHDSHSAEQVSVQSIQDILIPRIEAFLEDVEKRYDIQVDRREPFSNDDILKYYTRAKKLDDLLVSVLHQPVRCVPIDEFLDIDCEIISDMVRQAQLAGDAPDFIVP